MDIVSKIKKANLAGCGGACFPTAQKWQAVREAQGKTKAKYVIMNASEGEPNVFKDGYLLAHYPNEVINGMKLAIDFLSDKNSCVKGFIYINRLYYQKYGQKLKKAIKEAFPDIDRKELPIEFFIKHNKSGYIGGEETALINAIEKGRAIPRLKPPYPTTNGLWDCPTLVNNVETLYHVHLIKAGKYKSERFFSINGDCQKKGVYSFPGDWTIEKVLKDSGNYPSYEFFVQVGGGASGEILNQNQLKQPARGAMSLTLYKTDKYGPKALIRKWASFFVKESCGQCTPCREGNYRLLEIIDSLEPDWPLFSELLDNLDQSSLCGLGCVVPVPIESYVKNILSQKEGNRIKIEATQKRIICECFK